MQLLKNLLDELTRLFGIKYFSPKKVCCVKIRREKMNKNFRRVVSIICLIFVITAFLLSFTQEAKAQEKIKKEIILQVKSRIIALPGNEAAKVPISAARIRSDELRELNKEYNAVSIEKIYALKEYLDVLEREKKKVSLKGIKTEQEEAKDKEKVNVQQVFTRKIKEQMIEAGKEVRQVTDSFIILFERDTSINMSRLLSDYRAVDTVIYADEITRRK